MVSYVTFDKVFLRFAHSEIITVKETVQAFVAWLQDTSSGAELMASRPDIVAAARDRDTEAIQKICHRADREHEAAASTCLRFRSSDNRT